MLGLIAAPYKPAAITGVGTFLAAFPVTNAGNDDYGRVAKNTGGGQIIVDLGSAKEVDTIAVLWHTYTGNITVGAGSSQANAQSGASFSGVATARTGSSKRDPSPRLGKFLMTLSSSVSARYWAISVPGTGQLSRVMIGKKALFGIGPQKAMVSVRDLNQTLQLDSGEDRGSQDAELIRPVASLSFEYAKESEMSEVLGRYTYSGTSLPLLLTTDAAGTYLQDTLVFGKPEKVISVDSEFYDVWKFNATIQSIGM